MLCYYCICAQSKQPLSTVTFIRSMYQGTQSVQAFMDICVAIKFLQSATDRLRKTVRVVRAQRQGEMLVGIKNELTRRCSRMGFSAPTVQRGMSMLSPQQLMSTQNLDILVELLASTSPHCHEWLIATSI